jgi:anti-sigma factor RsiW
MSLLSDEILNQYLDGDLDEEKRIEVEEILRKSEADRKSLNALKLVHNQLSSVIEYRPSADFTSKVMNGIATKFVLPKRQNYFVIAVASVFVFICLVIVGYIVTAMISSAPAQSETVQITDTVNNLSGSLITELKKLFNGKNLSIIGSIFSLGIMISGYFFFEHQKKLKLL